MFGSKKGNPHAFGVTGAKKKNLRPRCTKCGKTGGLMKERRAGGATMFEHSGKCPGEE